MRNIITVLGGAVVIVVACGGKPSPESTCSQVCEKTKQCKSDTDVITCTNDCKRAFGTYIEKSRADYVDAVVSCHKSKDCSAVLTVGLLQCVSEASARIAPTGATESYCDELVATLQKCSLPTDKGACLSTAKFANDATLNEAKACLQRPCAQIGSCITSVLTTPG